MKKLPIAGSTAATTAFCSAQLHGPDYTQPYTQPDSQLCLYFDGNGKITRENGTLSAPKPNAFSLPAAGLSGIEHCPGSTEVCRKACYVEGLNRAQPDLYALYERNASAIRSILAGSSDDYKGFGPVLSAGALDWAQLVAEWIEEHAPGGFRWHVSGDVYSMAYAAWITEVCRNAPSVPFWIYTRSFAFLAPLAEESTLRGGNLAINLSCDSDNYEAAKAAATHYGLHDEYGPTKRLRLCYLTIDGTVPGDMHDDEVIFPDYNLRPRQFATLAESPWWQTITAQQRGLVCPVDAFGKAENRRCGPCKRCLM